MTRMFVRHDVEDYARWRQAYHDFDSAETAQAFAGSARLKQVMQGAGVTSAPQIWFVDEA